VRGHVGALTPVSWGCSLALYLALTRRAFFSGLFLCTRLLWLSPRRYYLDMHVIEMGTPPLVKTAARLFRELCYSNKSQLMAGMICAGWDSAKGGQVRRVCRGWHVACGLGQAAQASCTFHLVGSACALLVHCCLVRHRTWDL